MFINNNCKENNEEIYGSQAMCWVFVCIKIDGMSCETPDDEYACATLSDANRQNF